jgi:two-component system response regulator FixJ
VATYQSPRGFLEETDPDRGGCLLLDWRMPELSGLELLGELRRRRVTLPVIVLTAHGDVAACSQAFKAGALDFLEKPADDQSLIEIVRRALALDAQRRAQSREAQAFEQRYGTLSPREREVAELLGIGKPLKQIAIELGIVVQTAAKHRARALEKLGVGNDVELVRQLLHARPSEVAALSGTTAPPRPSVIAARTGTDSDSDGSRTRFSAGTSALGD